ncbi:MAG: efflux RND transporter periplasmic adaptor subunit, partial [Azoarcus sp.]|nr:efflux RND transporter periplasmic adaptor subunit [Azoarcus sp.]
MAIWLLTRPKPIDVAVHVAGRGRVESTVINTRAGVVEACQRTRLSTITGGRIDYLGAKEGDRVTTGQVLMRLWQGDLHANQSVAQARMASAQQRQLEACALADQAEKEARRQEELVKSKFVSPNMAEKYRAEADSRTASCASAAAEVETAKRQLDSIATDLDRTVIIAPFDGTIARINGELGEISTPSPTGIAMPPAIDLINDSCLYVKAPMDEVDAPRIRPGQAVRISVEAIKGKRFTGKVRRVAPYITAVEKQARTVDIDIDFNTGEETHQLLVGYSVDVEIVLASRNNVLRIPSNALRAGNKVLLLDGGVIVE